MPLQDSDNFQTILKKGSMIWAFFVFQSVYIKNKTGIALNMTQRVSGSLSEVKLCFAEIRHPDLPIPRGTFSYLPVVVHTQHTNLCADFLFFLSSPRNLVPLPATHAGNRNSKNHLMAWIYKEQSHRASPFTGQIRHYA